MDFSKLPLGHRGCENCKHTKLFCSECVRKARGEQMTTIKQGDRVRVHDPEWRDAAGRHYDAGRNHGKTGHIAEVTDYKCGSERLYLVRFDDGRECPHWTSELRVASAERVAEPNKEKPEQQALW